jgi:hypothetical protein
MFMKIRNLIVLGLFLGLSSSSALAFSVTGISGLSITPSNPSPGQTVAVTWTYTQDGNCSPHLMVA